MDLKIILLIKTNDPCLWYNKEIFFVDLTTINGTSKSTFLNSADFVFILQIKTHVDPKKQQKLAAITETNLNEVSSFTYNKTIF